ncbi:hypothetical protein TorRG33x02_107810, partial [Trema orientale]
RPGPCGLDRQAEPARPTGLDILGHTPKAGPVYGPQADPFGLAHFDTFTCNTI